jgi:ABC-type microcin C transport system duplicated ATPase subunit YejF
VDKELTATVDIRVSIAEEDTYAIDLTLHLQYLDLLQATQDPLPQTLVPLSSAENIKIATRNHTE